MIAPSLAASLVAERHRTLELQAANWRMVRRAHRARRVATHNARWPDPGAAPSDENASVM